jgi:hypothetical protein
MNGNERPLTFCERKLQEYNNRETAIRNAIKILQEDHQIVVVEKLYIPKNAKLLECYETESSYIIMGFPENGDESHDCDEMGCGSLTHVLIRISKQQQNQKP